MARVIRLGVFGNKDMSGHTRCFHCCAEKIPVNKRRERILVFTHLAGINFKLGYGGLGEPWREGGGLRRSPYTCEREKHHEREV